MFSVTLLAFQISHRTAISHHERRNLGFTQLYHPPPPTNPHTGASARLIIYNPRGETPVERPMTELPKKPRIAIGSDHAGFLVKETIRKYLEASGYTVDDQGTSSEESVDYPDYGKAVGERVASKQADLGIAVCGSGIGISIAANKVPGIRAALVHDVTTARLAREHNDANILALGGRIVTPEAAVEMVQTFLATAYLGGRHQRRLDKIIQIERDSHLS
jgi:ribose 5-phosphate isomerase B